MNIRHRPGNPDIVHTDPPSECVCNKVAKKKAAKVE